MAYKVVLCRKPRALDRRYQFDRAWGLAKKHVRAQCYEDVGAATHVASMRTSATNGWIQPLRSCGGHQTCVDQDWMDPASEGLRRPASVRRPGLRGFSLAEALRGPAGVRRPGVD